MEIQVSRKFSYRRNFIIDHQILRNSSAESSQNVLFALPGAVLLAKKWLGMQKKEKSMKNSQL